MLVVFVHCALSVNPLLWTIELSLIFNKPFAKGSHLFEYNLLSELASDRLGPHDDDEPNKSLLSCHDLFTPSPHILLLPLV